MPGTWLWEFCTQTQGCCGPSSIHDQEDPTWGGMLTMGSAPNAARKTELKSPVRDPGLACPLQMNADPPTLC